MSSPDRQGGVGFEADREGAKESKVAKQAGEGEWEDGKCAGWGTSPSKMLIDDSQFGSEDFLELPFVFVVQLADVGIHDFKCKSAESLRPLVVEFVQRDPCTTTGNCIFGEYEAVAVVLFHAILPPFDRNL